MSKRTARTALATLGVVTLALTGCASGGAGDAGDDASSTLEKAQESGTITLAVAAERPYSWVEGGEPTGATIALHEKIFAGLGIDDIEVKEVEWNALIPGLNAGRWDVISAGMSILPDRCEQAAFSDPEIMYTTTLAVPKGNPDGLSDLDSIAEFDAILSSGHLHVWEIWKLFTEAKKRGVKRLLVNHPMYGLHFTYEDIKEMAEFGALIEQSACLYIDSRFNVFSPEELREHILAAGVAHSSIGSDLGQVDNPTPVEGLRQAIKLCLALGFSEDEVRMMVRDNPARLVGLDVE